MVAKMITLTLCVIATLGGVSSQGDKYPAGVDPNLCPNYPHCDNILLGEHASAAGAVAHAYAAPAYEEPSYAAPTYSGRVYAAPAYSGRAYAAPAYSAPAYSAPSYAAATYSTPAYSGRAYEAPVSEDYGHASVAVPVVKGYPAAVTPQSCPNYPWCGPTPVHVPAKALGAPATFAYAAPAPKFYAAPAPKVFAAPAPKVSAAPASYPYGATAAYTYASNANDGHRYPAGLNPSSCPNYPYCH